MLASAEPVFLGPVDPTGLGELTLTGPQLPLFTFVYSPIVTWDGGAAQATDVFVSISF